MKVKKTVRIKRELRQKRGYGNQVMVTRVW